MDARDGMKVTLGQNPIGDGRWLRAFDIENVYGTPFDDVFLGPKSGADGAVALWGFLGTTSCAVGTRLISCRATRVPTRSWDAMVRTPCSALAATIGCAGDAVSTSSGADPGMTC